jgi:hypothetical protein
MPIQILHDIQPHHLPLVWRELKLRYGFNTAAWENSFEQAFERRPRGTERVEFFLCYGAQTINPILNRVLHRSWDYPTFLRLVEYIVYNEKRILLTPTLPQLSNSASSGYS